MGIEEERPLVSLEQLESGTHGIVRQLQGGKELGNRLTAMGLSIGSEFEVMQNRGNGPVLVKVRGTRIAFGHGEALKILVEELQ